MGLCLMKMGQYERSNYLFDKVINLDEFNAKAHSRKLLSLYEMKNYEALKKEMKKILLQPSCYDVMVRN